MTLPLVYTNYMVTIFSTLVVSLVVAYLATQNATLVTLRFGQTVLADIPLFFVVLFSMIFGTLLASIVTLINLIKSKWTIFGQKGQLKKSYKTVGELQQRVSELEGENATLRDQIKELAPSLRKD
jgi:uncharacterized integral membrane protein